MIDRIAAFLYWHVVPGWMMRCDIEWINDVYLWFASCALSEEFRHEAQEIEA